MSDNFDSNQNHYFFLKKNTTPLVFIHGVGLDHQMWQSQISKLNEFSIITYDLLGHGKTPCKKEKLSLNDFSKQLDEILNNLQVNKINELKSELNLQNLQVWSNFPGIDHKACMRSIKLFNDEVIPKINLDSSNIEKAS